MSQITVNELKEFLDLANKNTYANKDAKKVDSTREGSRDYHFEAGDLVYHDTYFGKRDFIGEEIVYKQGNCVWGANYFGFITDNEIDENDLGDFLRKALMQEYESDVPIRGPEEFSDGDWTYEFSVKGDLGNFYSEETIKYRDKVVYRCLVHGGMIK